MLGGPVEAAERGSPEPWRPRPDLLSGTTDVIAVTGTGWFGRTTLELLFDALGDAAATPVLAYGSRPDRIELSTGHTVTVRPLHELPAVQPSPTIVLHYACLTRDRESELGTAAYLQANLDITTTTLRALEAHTPSAGGHVVGCRCGVRRRVRPRPATQRLRDAEAPGRARLRPPGRPTRRRLRPSRVYSVAGPWMTKPLLYALGSMIAMARAGGPITITAPRPVWRSYCGVAEVVALSLWLATQRANTVFDTGGHVVEMAGLAASARPHRRSRAAGSARPALDPDCRSADRYVGDPAVVRRGCQRMAGLAAWQSAWTTW